MAHDKAAVRKILDKVKGEGRTSLTAPEGKLVCDAYGIPVPKEGVASSAADAGMQVFRRSACIGCHTIAGISQGKVGPDLSHVGSRATIAGALFPNTTESLRRWIANAVSLCRKR